LGERAWARLAFGGSVGLDVWHFNQVGPAARDIGGLALASSSSAAWLLGQGFAVGAELGSEVYLPAGGTLKWSSPNRPFSSSVAPGYEVGSWPGGIPSPIARSSPRRW
jgi:hypothetical protein